MAQQEDLTGGNISLLRGWPNPGTGFLERWSMPQACSPAHYKSGDDETGICLKCQGFFSSQNTFKDTNHTGYKWKQDFISFF